MLARPNNCKLGKLIHCATHLLQAAVHAYRHDACYVLPTFFPQLASQAKIVGDFRNALHSTLAH